MKLLKGLDRAIYQFRTGSYDRAIGIVADSIEQMKTALEAIIKDRDYFNLVSTDSVLDMLTGILNAQKKSDYILLADLLELQLVSFLCGVQELIISKEEIEFDEAKYQENIQLLRERETGFTRQKLETINPVQLLEEGYRVEFTSTGLMTLAAENNGSEFYFHTNSRIYSEAAQLAGHWYKKGTIRYIVYGFGMGYHVEELMEVAPEAELEVYESDLNVIKLACAFHGVKDILYNDRMKLIYDPELTVLTERLNQLSKEEAMVIHYPSYQNIRTKAGREMMESFIPWSKTTESC
jgi:hypothetical protein